MANIVTRKGLKVLDSTNLQGSAGDSINDNHYTLGDWNELNAKLNEDNTFTENQTIPTIQLDASAGAPAHSEGVIFYDNVEKTLAVYNNQSDVTLQLGQELYIRANNNTGVDIANGAAVYISGALTGNPTVGLAQSNSASTSQVVAIATHLVVDGTVGFFTTFGKVNDLNTSSFTEGEALYLSSSSAGTLTKTAPSAPNFVVQVATVVKTDISAGSILVHIGDTSIVGTVVINDLDINENLDISGDISVGGVIDFNGQYSSVTASGIDVTHTFMGISGESGPVEITGDPSISAGLNGQLLYLKGNDDTNTVQINNNGGVKLQGTAVLGDHDFITLVYDVEHGHWNEISRNFAAVEKAWTFTSFGLAAGTDYVGGFYVLNSGNSDFGTPQTLGNANVSYAAHAFIVTGAETTNALTIRVSGTSITDAGARTTSDTQDIVIPGSTAANSYYETSKKWLGQVTLTYISGDGKQCNWGYAKYWDNNNNDFRVEGLEATWVGNATDANPNISLIHHKTTGWTYNVGSEPTPPTAIADMITDHVTETRVESGIPGAWKRSNLLTTVSGSASEGTIFQIDTNSANTFSLCNLMVRIRPA